MYVSPDLPWSVDPAEQRRFRIIFVLVFVLLLGFELVVTLFVVLPEPGRAELEKVPPRVAKLVLERKPPPPPPPQERPEPAKEEPPPPKQEEKKPVERPKSRAQQVQEAREKASRSGLLAMRDKLAALRERAPQAIFKRAKPMGQEGKARRTERDLITQRAEKASGGVETQHVEAASGERLATRGTSQVEAPAGIDTGEGGEEAAVGQRTSEEIQLAFERNKAAIYALYRRALRRNLGLQGRVVLELEVAPSGEVTACRIVSSELDNAKLERKLLARVRMIDFGERDVLPWKGTYHIDFLPSS
ncbi:MAG: TonB family protein [Gammaproteobacteria bacterium]|nr:TonB family protein [Gammaproteobacteria bacterium]NIR31090.1 TonB family protein [Gammaproteobacteria bacterium]NIR98545.1 TonB family protein [Gammaproteobacteria bacterium]NIT64267.1 TonB family protein [Gammaproteobacteria bacterium]NIV21872.1 TonB family protein [Gammaproteobacteria bacterium]